MKSLLRLMRAVALSLPVFAGYAHADDYGVSSRPTWRGLYVGFHDGGAWGESDWTLSDGSASSPNLDAGALFGGHAGYLDQWGVLVAGVEISYSGLPNVDGNAWCPTRTAVCETTIENLLMLNGRLGFDLGWAIMYATAGWARSTVDVTRAAALAASDDRHLSGWDVGGGIEFMIFQHVILGVEYLYVDYDDRTLGLTNGGALIESVSIDPNLDVVRARFTVQLY